MAELEDRRSAELELVSSAYGPEEAWCEYDYQQTAHLHRLLSLRRDEDSDATALGVKLTLNMVPGYLVGHPLEISATLEKSCSIAEWNKVAWNALPNLIEACRETAESLVGEEAVWVVLKRAEEWVESEWPTFFRRDMPEDVPLTQPEPDSRTFVLGRRLIYSHHIIASSKRTAIRDLTSHYHLTGYVKIGWPGIILIEGREEDCLNFVDEIRKLSWQYLVVRGEEQEKALSGSDLERKRKLCKFQEVTNMSVLAQQCREVGLEPLFRTSMKNYKEKKVEESPNGESPSFYGALVHVDHMNNGKAYRNWLRKTSRDLDCSLLLRQCFSNEDYASRPIIVVGLFGRQESVREFLKRWRVSRVDVNSKGRPCVERKMTVLVDGPVSDGLSRVNWEDFQTEASVNSSYERLLDTVSCVGGNEWAAAFRNLKRY